MQFRFANVTTDAFDQVERPTLILYRADDTALGCLREAFDVSAELKYNELSTAQFSYPKTVDGQERALYRELTIGRVVEIDPYGRFIITSVEETEEDGHWVAKVSLYSLEYELANKQIVFGEGTYKLYSPTDATASIMGFALEKTMNWTIGSVDASLWNRYRTFAQTEQGLLDFLYNVVQETYGCVVVFDTFNRKINIVEANAGAKMVPVFLSSETVLKEQNLSTSDNDVATRVSVYGADDVDVRDVNPTGGTDIINLGYALTTGDLHGPLAEKYIGWKREILAQQDYYTGIVSLRNSTASRLLAEKARLTDLKGTMTELENTHTTTLKMLNTAKQQETIDYMRQRLREIETEQDTLRGQIAAQEALIKSIEADYTQYTNDALAVTNRLKVTAYFTQEELKLLDRLFIEGTFSDATFATYDVDISGSDDVFIDLTGATLKFDGVTVIDVKMPQNSTHRILDISGGTLSATGGPVIQADVMHATLDAWGQQGVCSVFTGSSKVGESAVQSANLSIAFDGALNIDGFLAGMTKHSETITDSETGVSYTKYHYTGVITISDVAGKMYVTKNATEYQKYSVQKELFDFASDKIDKMAYPVTEFELKSTNLVYAKELAPFREALELGSAVYLKISDGLLLRPVLLEVHLDFEDATKFDLIFSNQFQTKRHDAVNQLSEILKKSSNASKTLDLSKYEFGRFDTSGAASAVENFLKNGMDAAYQQVVAGQNQTVTIDGTGVKVCSVDRTEYIMLANGMIAIIDTATKETKAAIGHFYNDSTQTDFNGVLADVIGGTLFAGKNMHMECFSPDGKVTQFKFDGTGAFLNNSRLYLQSDAGGRIGIDPEHGFLAGTAALFSVTDTGIIKPSCKDAQGKLIFDEQGFPKDTNVYIGLDGKAYFRGNIYADNGYFNGEIHATSGTFKGVVQASDFLDAAGKSMMTDGKWDSEYLNVKGLNVNNNFIIDEQGRVTINSGSISWGAVTGTDAIDQQIQNAQSTANAAERKANQAYDLVNNLDIPTLPGYIKNTYIDASNVASFHIIGNKLEAVCPEGTGAQEDVGFILTSQWNMQNMQYLKIWAYQGDAPYTVFQAPNGNFAEWRFGQTNFYGNVEFSHATVYGLSAQFG